MGQQGATCGWTNSPQPRRAGNGGHAGVPVKPGSAADDGGDSAKRDGGGPGGAGLFCDGPRRRSSSCMSKVCGRSVSTTPGGGRPPSPERELSYPRSPPQPQPGTPPPPHPDTSSPPTRRNVEARAATHAEVQAAAEGEVAPATGLAAASTRRPGRTPRPDRHHQGGAREPQRADPAKPQDPWPTGRVNPADAEYGPDDTEYPTVDAKDRVDTSGDGERDGRSGAAGARAVDMARPTGGGRPLLKRQHSAPVVSGFGTGGPAMARSRGARLARRNPG
ncbi:translation initiation factor IF-2-like [Drosophila biarmipes]|uniref:translation initiation factor IF-2-like n=1 Tax=Drosophila biarmipes TaxID=125945 RepID=UPI001CDAB9C3|nr:translation initiation factor IF-2-like [Drosophila biarmipes]